jgi:AraC family transcriptional regulator
VEVPADYTGPVPDGFDVVDAPPCQLMVFQGQPFDDEGFEDAIRALRAVIERHDPQVNGYRWADADAPRFQLIPLGYRGYIEGRPVRPLAA